MRLIKINYFVMPDLIRHPEYTTTSFLDSGFRRNDGLTGFPSCGENDKSPRDKGKFASPKGEGFQPSPKGTLSFFNP
jgi:hypothetical protein